MQQQEHLTVKELPDSERPYEKCLNYGPEYLSDAELLAVILRTGTKGRTSVELAQKLLSDGNRNLLNLYDYDISQMMQFPGIGKTKAVQLKCIAELSRRIAKTTRISQLRLENPKSIANYFMEEYRHKKQEHFWACMFDSKCSYLGQQKLSIGTVNMSLVSPREVFLAALKSEAVFIVLLHNHPSGQPQPSPEDLRTTQRIAECGKLLQIQLADHIIIGDNQYYSFREKGLLEP